MTNKKDIDSIILQGFRNSDKKHGTSYAKHFREGMDGYGSWWFFGLPIHVELLLKKHGDETAIEFVEHICSPGGKDYIELITTYGPKKGSSDEERAIKETCELTWKKSEVL